MGGRGSLAVGGHHRNPSGSSLLLLVDAQYQQQVVLSQDHHPAARRAVLGLLFLATLQVFALVQMLAPFFPQLAQESYRATPFLVGGETEAEASHPHGSPASLHAGQPPSCCCCGPAGWQ